MSAPLRIRRPAASGMKQENSDTIKSYLDRLMKMIPGEVVGLYLVGIGFIPQTTPAWLIVWAVICLIGVVVVKAYGTSDSLHHIKPDWIHVLISCVSFVIWVYTMGGPFAAYGIWIPWLGSLLVLVWTFFIPKFYKGPLESTV